jgi:prepilin-type N-terminal cleavage/methylation domain-containing protein
MKRKHLDPRLHGFTIVELLIVIVVIGILAAITIVAYNGISTRSRIASMQIDLAAATRTLELAKINSSSSQYPIDITSANLKSSNGSILNYKVDNPASPSNYCLTILNSGIAYKATNTNTAPTLGICSGVMSDGSSCPNNFIVVSGNSSFGTSDFCMMKYEARQGSGVAVSQASGTPWVNITQTNAIIAANATCSGCHLVTEGEWMTVAANALSVASNWSGGAVGSGYIYSGHNNSLPNYALPATTDDTDGYNGTGSSSGNQRRTLTLTNGEVIWDLAGNVWEWTNAIIGSNAQPGLVGEGSYSFKEWNNGALNMNGLPSLSRPAAISSQAATWSSIQGVGQLFSYYPEVNPKVYLRSGSWSDGNAVGVLSLDFFDSTGMINSAIGFRVDR